MKKSVKRFLAVLAVLILTLCVLSSCSDNTQAKVDDAVKAAKEAAVKEMDEAVAAAKAAGEEALKAAQDASDSAKAELEGKVSDLTAKISEMEESAKTALEAALKEKDDVIANLKTEGETALQNLKAEGEKALKDAQEAADAVKSELEGKVNDLTAKLAETEESAKAALENAAKEKDEAVAAAKAAGEEALKAAQEAADKTKAELEEKVSGLEKQIAEATEALKEKAAEATEAVEEKVEEAADAVKDKAEEVTEAVEEKVEDAAEAVAEKAEEVTEAVEEKAEEAAAEEKTETAVMSHADYIAAELESAVCVETYVQATQSWWDNKITIYAQSEDGAYFIYNAACTEEEAAKLVPGTKIHVDGYKAEWAGEVEIIDAKIEILDGDPFIAEAKDCTDLLGKDELIERQNEKVSFKGLTVAAQDDGAAFNYKNAVDKTDDLYVRFTKDDVTADFCVEFYLCNQDTDVYKAVEGLSVGDVVDIEGFLYWYNGANVHMTALTK